MAKLTQTGEPQVTRNEVEETFQRSKMGKTSNTPGREFFKLSPTSEENFDSRITFLSKAEAGLIVDRYLRQASLDIYSECVDENTGELNLETFTKEWENFTVGIERLSGYEDELARLSEEIQSIIMGSHKVHKITNREGQEYAQSLGAQAATVKEKYADLKVKWEAIAAKRKKRTKKATTTDGEAVPEEDLVTA